MNRKQFLSALFVAPVAAALGIKKKPEQALVDNTLYPHYKMEGFDLHFKRWNFIGYCQPMPPPPYEVLVTNNTGEKLNIINVDYDLLGSMKPQGIELTLTTNTPTP